MLRKVDAALAHRLFYPAVPAVLSARSGKTVAAMPVISYSSLSGKPPLFGVSCAKGSFTLDVVRASKEFSVCLLGESHAKAIELLASGRGKAGSDKLEGAGLRHRRGRTVRAPVILGSVAVLECSLQRIVKTGDHVLIVGRVKAALASDDFRAYWSFSSYRPMLYAGWRNGVELYRPSIRRT